MPLIINTPVVSKTAESKPKGPFDPLVLSRPMIVKSEENVDPPAPPRRAVSETLMIKKVVKEEPKKKVRHSDFMMDMTTLDI